MLSFEVVPEAAKVGETVIGRIGAYNPVDKSFGSSLKYGFVETYTWTKEILIGFGKLVTGQFSIDMLSEVYWYL